MTACSVIFHKCCLDSVLRSWLKTLNTPLWEVCYAYIPIPSLIRQHPWLTTYTHIQLPEVPDAKHSSSLGLQDYSKQSIESPRNLSNSIQLATYNMRPSVPACCSSFVQVYPLCGPAWQPPH